MLTPQSHDEGEGYCKIVVKDVADLTVQAGLVERFKGAVIAERAYECIGIADLFPIKA